MKTKLRVALLTPFPVRLKFGDKLEFRTSSSLEHPTSWVVNLIQLATATHPEVEFHVVTLNSHLMSSSFIEDGGVFYYFLRGVPFRLQAINVYQIDRLILRSALKQISPDVVEAFGTEGPYAYSAISAPYKCVVYMQGIVSEILRKAPKRGLTSFQRLNLLISSRIEKWTVRHGKTFIAENEFVAHFVQGLNPTAEISIIPNLINPLYFDISRNPKQGKPVILYIGAVSERKGYWI